MDYDELIIDAQRTKLLSGIGCLLWAIFLTAIVVGPIVYFTGEFIYNTKFAEKPLLVSHSPSDIHTIEIVEKGEPAFFGPSTVKIKYKNHFIERSISNDGAILKPSNISVGWTNDEKATITLYGDEQVPEIVEFKLKSKNETNPFQVANKDLGYLPFQTSVSPDYKNVIEFRRITYSKGSTSYRHSSPVRVYYGEKGTELTKYKEFQASDIEGYDHFAIYWSGDTNVMIDAIGINENRTTFVMRSMRINLNE